MKRGGRAHDTAGPPMSAGIKTFMRPEALDICLQSLLNFNWHEVIVADDNPAAFREDYEKVYGKYSQRLPLTVLPLEPDSGLAAGRNRIADWCSSDYILMLDDDQTVHGGLAAMMQVLDEDARVGGVSSLLSEPGGVRCSASNLYLEGAFVIKEIRNYPNLQRTSHGYRYVVLDLIPNATLFRRECLATSAWDPNYKIGREHLDFYLTHKQLGRWIFAVCLDASIRHDTHLGEGEYRGFRRGERVAASDAYFRRKFGVRGTAEGKQLIGGQQVFTRLRSLGAPVPWARGGARLWHGLGRRSPLRRLSRRKRDKELPWGL